MSEDEDIHRFDRQDGELSAAIVTAVATVTDADPIELPSLYEAVDTDALEALVERGTDTAVSFPYGGVTVTVTGSGEIRVEGSQPGGTVHDAIADANTVLLLGRTAETTCRELAADPSRGDRLAVTYSRSVEALLGDWGLSEGTGGSTTVVRMGAVTRSAAADGAEPGPPLPLSVEGIEDPGDISALEVTLHDHVNDVAGEPGGTTVCFHSVTELLEHVDERTARRFLDSLAGRFAAADALGHFHVDPGAHEAATLAWLADLFDVVVEEQPDGTRLVREE